MGNEPALVVAALAALVNLAVGFGVKLSPEQVTLINTAIIAVMAVVIRQRVTPNPPSV